MQPCNFLMQKDEILTFMTAEKIKMLRIELDLNQQDFADLVGVSKRSIANYESGETEPNSRTLLRLTSIEHKIVEAKHHGIEPITYIRNKVHYSKLPSKEINEGNILVKEPLEIFNTKAGSNYEELPNGKYLLTVPMVPVRAQATYISEFADAEYISDLKKISFIVDRIGKGKYQAFEVQNDSMNDGTINSIPDGAIVLGRELGKQHWKNKLNTNGYPYWIIVHKNTILCKEIIAQDLENGTITCHSLNDSPEFQDFTIKLDDCHQLFNIIKKQI